MSRTTHTGGRAQNRRDRSRIATARTHPAPVTVKFRCPRCGRDHRADEHGIAD